MAATVLHSFSECTGIEVLGGLHAVAIELLACFEDKVLPKMTKREKNTSTSAQFFFVFFMFCLL